MRLFINGDDYGMNRSCSCAIAEALGRGLIDGTTMMANGEYFDEAVKLSPYKVFTLEEALEFINDDELVEVTPTDIRLRKKILGELERKRSGRVYTQE